ncbi:hypothetical protein ASG33_20850 [Dyadobacter sp. Leaf189]|nr:hypothetical protein ASG33_20850 [Dyadobacter sp. Leaf189]
MTDSLARCHPAGFKTPANSPITTVMKILNLNTLDYETDFIARAIYISFEDRIGCTNHSKNKWSIHM